MLIHLYQRTCQGKCSLKQSEQPSHSIGPANLIDEVAVDKLARLVIRGRGGQDRNADDDEAGNRPEKGGLGEERQDSGHESIDDQGNESEADVNQKLMPGLGLKVGVKQRNDVHDERAAKQTTGSTKGNPAGDIDPPSHVADTAAPSFP